MNNFDVKSQTYRHFGWPNIIHCPEGWKLLESHIRYLKHKQLKIHIRNCVILIFKATIYIYLKILWKWVQFSWNHYNQQEQDLIMQKPVKIYIALYLFYICLSDPLFFINSGIKTISDKTSLTPPHYTL